MLNGDMTTAWALYDELLESSLSPKQETWDALFNNVTRGKEEEGEAVEVMSHTEHQQRLLRILLYMRNNQIYPQKNLINSIKTWFERYRRTREYRGLGGRHDTTFPKLRGISSLNYGKIEAKPTI